MRTFSAFALGALFSLTLAPQLTAAPQFGAGRERAQNNRDRVCVYKDIQFGGTEQCYNPGDEIATLQSQRGSVSSIRIYGRARVTVYDDTNFRGHSAQFTSSVPDLGRESVGGSKSWSDRIQSLRVDSGSGTYGNAPIYGGNQPRRYPDQQQQSVSEGVCVYDRPNYQGRSQCWSPGEGLNDLGRAGNWSDRISSIRVFGRAEVVAYRDTGFRGESIVFDRDVPDLAQVSARSFRNWDRQISSVQVETERGGFPGRGRGRGRFWR